MNPDSVTTQPPYKLQMWPAHLLIVAASGMAVMSLAYPSATRQHTWPWAPLLAGLWLTPVIATVGRLSFRNSWTWPNLILSAGLALLTGTTLLSAAASPFAHLSLLRVWPTLAGVALFFWLHDWLAETPRNTQIRSRLLGRILAGFGALLTVVSLIGWAWRNGGFNWSSRNEFPFGHSIYNAGAMVLVLPWLIHAIWRAKDWQNTTAWSIATLLGFVALFTTSSRGGVFAVGTVCVATAIIVLVRATWSAKIKARVVAATAIILVLAVWSNPRLRALTQTRSWSASAAESNVQRSAMIEAGFILGRERPLIGWGPGTIPLAYPQVRHQLHGGVDSVLQLHNTPAQLWATLGSGGVLALLILLAACARRLGQIARLPSPPPLTLTSAASLIGYGLFSLTDHQLDVPAMNAILVINLTLFFADERVPHPHFVSRTAKWRFSLALVIVLLAPLGLKGRDLLARFAYEQSLVLFDAGRTSDGYSYLETAAERAPYDPYYRHQFFGRLIDQRSRSKDNAEQAQLTTRAIAELEKSLGSGCLQEFAHFNLGWLALETGEPARAIPHFFATVQEAPHRGGAYLGLGLALQATGHEIEAVRAYALEWINDPIAFTGPLWIWPDFAPLRPKILREADALLAELTPQNATARYLRELCHWWDNGAPVPIGGFNAESDAFTQTLTALAQKQSPPTTADAFGWTKLLKAWQQPPAHHAFAALSKYDEPFAAALERRTARHAPPDWHGFLTAGLEEEPSLLIETRYSRPGYGVLALHPDGPVLSNLFVMQQNRLVATFASGLFPAKGWIKASELLTRLPVVPATP